MKLEENDRKQRLQEFKEVTNKYRHLLHKEVQDDNDISYIIRDELYIDKKIFDTLYAKRKDLIQYLIPWTDNSRIVSKRDEIKIKFPLNEGKEYEGTKDIILSSSVMGSFWFHKLYTDEPDFECFEMLESFGGCSSFDYELPSSRCSIKGEGQLKLTTDAAIAVDDMEKKDMITVKVSGSAGDSGFLCGVAYEVIGSMITNSIIDLYDPNTVNCEYKDSNNNIYRHHSEEFDYSNISCDLLLDDAWRDNRTHEDLDRDQNSYTVKNYSVKHFKWDEKIGNEYKQAFDTANKESRLVSREMYYNYRHHEGLGRCPACIELKYCLKNDYTKEFYDRFMRAHKRNCITKVARLQDIADDVMVSFRDVKIKESIKKRLTRLPWDYDMKHFPIIPMNDEIMRNSICVISHEKMLTNNIAQTLKGILKDENGHLSYMGAEDPDIIFLEVNFKIEKGHTINYHQFLHREQNKSVVPIDFMKWKNVYINLQPYDNTPAMCFAVCKELDRRFNNEGYFGFCVMHCMKGKSPTGVLVQIASTNLDEFESYLEENQYPVVDRGIMDKQKNFNQFSFKKKDFTDSQSKKKIK